MADKKEKSEYPLADKFLELQRNSTAIEVHRNGGCVVVDRSVLNTILLELLASNPITPEVVIDVLGGVAHLEIKSVGVQVTFRDYDNATETKECSEEIWDESEKI